MYLIRKYNTYHGSDIWQYDITRHGIWATQRRLGIWIDICGSIVKFSIGKMIRKNDKKPNIIERLFAN